MTTIRLPRLRAAAAVVTSVAALATGAAALATVPAGAATTTADGSSAGRAAQAVRVTDTLLPDQTLRNGQYIKSKSGAYTLLNSNGVFQLTIPHTPALWTVRHPRGTVLRVTQDGGLEFIYGRTRVGHLGATGSPGAKLVLPNTGNLAIYNTRGKAVWNRHMVIGTFGPGPLLRAADAAGREVRMYSVNRVYTLHLNPEGTLVLLQNGRTVLWTNAHKAGPNASAQVRVDGTFETLNDFGDTAWMLETRRPGTVVQLLNDGTLRLVHGRTIVRQLH